MTSIDALQVAIDTSANGQLPQNNPSTSPTVIHNITLFLFSYDTGFNFTISNATTTTPPLANILSQESSSTVKHVNWLWPSCLVGSGSSSSSTSARGNYNISIHQSFRLNGSDFYTVFDLPISVSNSINSAASVGGNPSPGPTNSTGGRIDCQALENQLLSPEAVNASIHAPTVQPFLGGPVVVSSGTNSGSGISNNNGGNSNTVTVTATTAATLFPAITQGSGNGNGGTTTITSSGSSTTNGLGSNPQTTCSSAQTSSGLTGCNGDGINSNAATSLLISISAPMVVIGTLFWTLVLMVY